MGLSAYDLQNILASGGNASVSARNYSAYDLQNCAASAANAGGSLTIRDAEYLSAYDAQNIASSGRGCVTLIYN